MSVAVPVPIPQSSLIELREVEWTTYENLRSSQANRGVRMTYDQGMLYLIAPSLRHERIAEIIGRLILAWTEVNGAPCSSGGSTTMKSQLLDRGLEPDKCYYLQNESAVRDSDDYDADVDPPPDLAVEVDVTSISSVRLPIYAAFGVPEIWRRVDEEIEIHRLKGGQYSEVTESVCLRGFPMAQALRTLARRHELDETSLVAEFRRSSLSSDPGDS